MIEKALKREYKRLALLKDYYYLGALKALSVDSESEYESYKMAYLKVKAQMNTIEEELEHV